MYTAQVKYTVAVYAQGSSVAASLTDLQLAEQFADLYGIEAGEKNASAAANDERQASTELEAAKKATPATDAKALRDIDGAEMKMTVTEEDKLNPAEYAPELKAAEKDIQAAASLM
jgi:hypothetical protein